MARFLSWFEAPGDADPLLTAAWRIYGSSPSIRLTMAMGASRAPSATWRSPAPNGALSALQMSAQIRRERDDTTTALERSQKGRLDITLWHEWS